jgi:hypothetical protein
MGKDKHVRQASQDTRFCLIVLMVVSSGLVLHSEGSLTFHVLSFVIVHCALLSMMAVNGEGEIANDAM